MRSHLPLNLEESHFAPKPCAPYRGNEKGKVERLIQFLRHSFFAARQFSSVEDLNAQLAHWIAEVAHTRRAPGHADGRSVPGSG
jgi:transposase